MTLTQEKNEAGKTAEEQETQKIEEELKSAEGASTETIEKEKTDSPVILSNDAEIEEFDKKLADLKETAKTKTEEILNPSVKEEETKKVDVSADDKSKTAEQSDKTDLEDKTAKATAVKIDEAYINSQPEEDRKILQGLKGKDEFIEVPPRFLKNYIHTQKYIEKLESEKETVLKQPDVKNIQTAKEDDTYIEDLTHQKMKELYPDRGDNPEEIKQFERDLAVDEPKTFQKYISDEINIRQSVENDVKRNIYMKQNQNEFAIKSTQKAEELFIKELERYGIKDAKEVLKLNKIDLTTFSEDGKNEQLTELIWDKTIPLEIPLRKFGGNGNPNDFSDKEGVYLIDPVKLYMRAMYKYGGNILTSEKERTSQASYERGLKKLDDKENLVPPSASASKESSQLKIVKTSDPRIMDNDALVEEMEDNLLKIKEKVRKKTTG